MTKRFLALRDDHNSSYLYNLDTGLSIKDRGDKWPALITDGRGKEVENSTENFHSIYMTLSYYDDIYDTE